MGFLRPLIMHLSVLARLFYYHCWDCIRAV